MNSEADIAIFEFEDYRLFLISDEKLFIAKEKSSEWFFYFQKEGNIKVDDDEEDDSLNYGVENDENVSKKKRSQEEKMKELEKKKLQKKEAAKKAESLLFKDFQVFNLKSVGSIYFDQGPISLITLKFGSS